MLAIAFAGGHECALVQALLARPRFQAGVPGFGSTDCRVCPAHLLTVRPGPDIS
jgi:Uri superfamily endonuclease